MHDVEASIALNHPDRPSIVISASGMATGGRAVHHLAAMLPEAKYTVVLVGFQAAGTRGRSLAEGARELKMLGRYVRVAPRCSTCRRSPSTPTRTNSWVGWRVRRSAA
ncbi:MAG: hypothetical protein R2705_16305 [Ilumatobacteraceae bacterium]